jgi:microcystin-dependent protein
MTSFNDVWDGSYETEPAGSVAANTLDTVIQGLKVDIRQRVDVEHHMDLSTGAEDGVHKFPAKTETTRDQIATPLGGQLVVRSDTRSIDIYDGSNWIEFQAFRPGDMKMAAYDDSAYPGWQKCDGTAISRTDYSDLWDTIGDEFGVGDGSTTFNVPDMSGKIPIGIGVDTDWDEIADETGDKVKTILEANLPEHAHSGGDLTTDDPGDHTHTLAKKQGAGGNMARISTGVSTGGLDETTSSGVGNAGAHTHVMDSGTTGVGDGTAADFNVMPPVITMQWYIKL